MTAESAARRAATRWATNAEGWDCAARSSARRADAARQAGQTPRASTTATVASAPSGSTSESNASPGGGLGQPSLAEGRDRGQRGSEDDGANGAGQTHHEVARHARAKSCRRDMPTATSVGWSSLSAAL